MKRTFRIAALCAALAGTALHFLYDLWPNPLFALLAPVNESVWEHQKLLLYPTLAAALVLSRRIASKRALASAFAAAVLLMPLALNATYYLLAAFGAEAVWLDILLYYVTMFGGFRLARRWTETGSLEKYTGWLLAGVLLYALLLSIFSFAAPAVPIFAAP